MRVGGYELHLYCDSERHTILMEYCHEYMGQKYLDAWKGAVKAGWTTKNGKDFCPVCSKAQTVDR